MSELVEVNGYFVHPTAIIDPGATIGKGTKIWHFSHICGGAVIGEDCSFGQNVFVGNLVEIGNRVKVQNNVSIYDKVTLEDEVFCGPSMVFTNDPNPRVAFPKDRETEYLPTLVKRGASIGANVTIVCGVSIGENALIGAGSIVTKNVEPHRLIYGLASQGKGWVCSCGTTLISYAPFYGCPKCRESYMIDPTSKQLVSRG